MDVVWDGIAEWPYVHAGHDYAITHDWKKLSVQIVRREVRRNEQEPIVVFACERGGSCVEAMIDGRTRGVFTHYFLQHFSMGECLRSLVSKINNSVWAAGYSQKAETICRADLLDTPIDKVSETAGMPVVFVKLDMCRS